MVDLLMDSLEWWDCIGVCFPIAVSLFLSFGLDKPADV